VVALDLPDHGDSASVHAANLPEAAAFVGAAGGRAAYVGYSLGGRVALTLALESPDLVDALVLVGAHPGIADPVERAARRAADDALADRLDPARGGIDLETFLAEWLAGPLFAHLSDDQADLAARRVNSPAGLAASLRSLGTGRQEPSLHRLGALAMPVLLVAGALDRRFADLGEQMAAAIGANARLALIEGAGHAAPFERPDAFVELVAGFLAAR